MAIGYFFFFCCVQFSHLISVQVVFQNTKKKECVQTICAAAVKQSDSLAELREDGLEFSEQCYVALDETIKAFSRSKVTRTFLGLSCFPKTELFTHTDYYIKLAQGADAAVWVSCYLTFQ